MIGVYFYQAVPLKFKLFGTEGLAYAFSKALWKDLHILCAENVRKWMEGEMDFLEDFISLENDKEIAMFGIYKSEKEEKEAWEQEYRPWFIGKMNIDEKTAEQIRNKLKKIWLKIKEKAKEKVETTKAIVARESIFAFAGIYAVLIYTNKEGKTIEQLDNKSLLLTIWASKHADLDEQIKKKEAHFKQQLKSWLNEKKGNNLHKGDNNAK